MRMDPCPFDDVADRYDKLYSDDASLEEDRQFIATWGHWLANEPILDVGCGTGWTIDTLQPTPDGYLGFDLSSEMINIARRKHPCHTFQQADMTIPDHWPHTPGGWGCVASLWCSASYLPAHPFATLAASILAPGGAVLAMPHAPGALHAGGVRDGEYLPEACYASHTGWQPWNATTAKKAFQRHFTDVTVEQFGLGTPFLVITGRRKPTPWHTGATT
jgi:SAM-dependent methyltransferase